MSDAEVDEDYDTDLYAAPPVSLKSKAPVAAEDSDDEDDEDNRDVEYGLPTKFGQGGTGAANLKNHAQVDESKLLYMVPPVKSSTKGNKVQQMIAKAKADQVERDALAAKVNAKKAGKVFKYQQNQPGSYLDVTPGQKKDDDDDDDSKVYLDVVPGGKKKKKNAADLVEYTTVTMRRPEDNDDGKYRDVSPNCPRKAASNPTATEPAATMVDKVESMYLGVQPDLPTAKTEETVQYVGVQPNQEAPTKVLPTKTEPGIYIPATTNKAEPATNPPAPTKVLPTKAEPTISTPVQHQEQQQQQQQQKQKEETTKANSKAAAETRTDLPPPAQRKADWREYKGENLGGRCKVRVYFSTTTSDRGIRKNAQHLQSLLERLKVHERPDFEPWIPIDMDMDREVRNKIFEKAETRKTPLLFIDDEYMGDWDMISEMCEVNFPAVQEMFKY